MRTPVSFACRATQSVVTSTLGIVYAMVSSREVPEPTILSADDLIPPALPALLHHADRDDRVARLQRRHRPDERDDARFRRARLGNDAAHVIGDVPDLHPLLDVHAALRQRTEDAVLLEIGR